MRKSVKAQEKELAEILVGLAECLGMSKRELFGEIMARGMSAVGSKPEKN
jgi:hypothetical protein